MRRSLAIAALTLFLGPSLFAGSLKKVTRTGGEEVYDSSVNQNFDRLDSELSNVVHKTSTETIRGNKYFVNPVDFSTATADHLSMSGTIDMNSNKITELSNGTASTDAAAFGQIPVVATQANQETGTDNTVFVSPGRQQYHPSAAKAWVNFNGTGTLAVRDSYNVSSVTDNGTGDYTVNFSTAFSGATYSAAIAYTSEVNLTHCAGFIDTIAAGSCRFKFFSVTNSAATVDKSIVGAVFFGDQ